MEPVYIAQILCDESIDHKIRHRAGGGCTIDEVREAFQFRDDVEVSWDDDAVHGLRLVGFGRTWSGRRLFAALLPVDQTDGVWRLKTARPT